MKIKKGVSLDPTTYEKAKKIAEYKGLSFSQYVDICLRVAIDKHEYTVNSQKKHIII